MIPASLSIPARFNGPPASGNGGYSCGVLAACVAGPARVRLHAPPPLDRARSMDKWRKWWQARRRTIIYDDKKGR